MLKLADLFSPKAWPGKNGFEVKCAFLKDSNIFPRLLWNILSNISQFCQLIPNAGVSSVSVGKIVLMSACNIINARKTVVFIPNFPSAVNDLENS